MFVLYCSKENFLNYESLTILYVKCIIICFYLILDEAQVGELLVAHLAGEALRVPCRLHRLHTISVRADIQNPKYTRLKNARKINLKIRKTGRIFFSRGFM